MKTLLSVALLTLPFTLNAATGVASYYHDMFEGRLTANGEIFWQSGVTCAHKTLPFGTVLEITNLSNGKTARCRVNDRGPFVKGRIVDLTRRTAKQLDMIKVGITKVKVSKINK